MHDKKIQLQLDQNAAAARNNLDEFEIKVKEESEWGDLISRESSKLISEERKRMTEECVSAARDAESYRQTGIFPCDKETA